MTDFERDAIESGLIPEGFELFETPVYEGDCGLLTDPSDALLESLTLAQGILLQIRKDLDVPLTESVIEAVRKLVASPEIEVDLSLAA